MEIKAHFREGRGSPWEARWYVNRRPRSKFFKNRKERDAFIRTFQQEIGKHGDEVFKFDKQRLLLWQQVDEILSDVNPLDVADFWIQHHPEEGNKTLAEATAAYLTHIQRLGRDSNSLRQIRKVMERARLVIGSDKPLKAITAETANDFIHGLPMHAISKRNHRSVLHTTFTWFMERHWIELNPFASVKSPKITLEEPGILTVEETTALFHANEKEDPDICALLALGAFAGMRSSAIARVALAEIDFEKKAILTPAAKTKKNRRQYIEGLPDNLFQWLSRASKKTFDITPREFAHRRQTAFTRAGLLITKEDAKRNGTNPKAPPKNCLRHSFVSYHVALHRNPGHTALLISHKNQNILYEHYLGVATKEDAERYFSIVPKV